MNTGGSIRKNEPIAETHIHFLVHHESQQPLDRPSQLPNLPPLPPHHRRRHLAQQPRQHHRLPQVPPVASNRHRRHRHDRLPRRLRRRLLPQHLPNVVLPLRHVLRHRRPRRLHHLRLRRHRAGLRPPPPQPRLLRLLSPGLFWVAQGPGRR